MNRENFRRRGMRPLGWSCIMVDPCSGLDSDCDKAVALAIAIPGENVAHAGHETPGMVWYRGRPLLWT